MLHLASVLKQSIDTLSRRFKRRVGLAQAILHDSDVLILDEPTDGLNPNQKHEVRQLIRSMSEEKHIVISTHILEEVNVVCTRAIIIDDGSVLVDGTPKNLTEKGDGDSGTILDAQIFAKAIEFHILRRRLVPFSARSTGCSPGCDWPKLTSQFLLIRVRFDEQTDLWYRR